MHTLSSCSGVTETQQNSKNYNILYIKVAYMLNVGFFIQNELFS